MTLYKKIREKYGKPKPILFNTEMVRAIIDGRKTQTRRPIKPQPENVPDNAYLARMPRPWEDDDIYYLAVNEDGKIIKHWVSYSKYRPGDILYVRETWRIGAWNEHKQAIAVDYKADNYIRKEWIKIEDEERFERYWIQSCEDAEKAGLQISADGKYHWEPGNSPCRWRPSIHMPKKFARIFPEVTDVRVERLQEMWDKDAEAEGFRGDDTFAAKFYFCLAWDNIYKEKGYGWNENPWVRVIEFEIEEIAK